MKENQKEESGSTNHVHSKKDSSSVPKPSKTGADKNMKEGEEFIKEGHGHDYSLPVAGEDGGTEDQSENKTKKEGRSSAKSQHSKPGNNKSEKSII
jgi:hypothetical protein